VPSFLGFQFYPASGHLASPSQETCQQKHSGLNLALNKLAADHTNLETSDRRIALLSLGKCIHVDGVTKTRAEDIRSEVELSAVLKETDQQLGH